MECIVAGCNQLAGTPWGKYWCPEHDRERLGRIEESFEAIAEKLVDGIDTSLEYVDETEDIST